MISTDPQDEPFIFVDANDKVIGTILRRDAHRNPALIHRAVAVMVFNPQGRLFLQKRSQSKDTYPGYWTISVSGHVNPGETYRQAAIKELREELGISEIKNLKFLRKNLMHFPNETEYYALFQLIYSGKISLNQEEIEAGKFFSLNRRFLKTTVSKLPLTPELQYILKQILAKKRFKNKS